MNPLRQALLMVPQVRRLRDARDALLGERDRLSDRLAACQTRLATQGGSAFEHYASRFDPEEVLHRHAAHGLLASPHHLTNFLGVRIDPSFLPGILAGRAGEIEGIPIPANWHADLAEWGAALRAVDLARDRFTVIELGCGWGCWMLNTGVAARRAGLAVHLVGVEGDEGHVGFAREACAENGFASGQVTLRRAVASGAQGVALFPRQGRSGVAWGSEPVFGADEEQRAAAARSGSHDALPMVTLDELAAPHGRVDLLHVDIQGGEADLVAGSLRVLREKVAFVLIGTHSRPIEGRLTETLLRAGWVLEIERPAILSLDGGRPLVTVDGVQGWRNPALAAG